MKALKIFAALVVVAVMAAAPAQTFAKGGGWSTNSTQYYVTQNGATGSTTCTQADPCATVGQALYWASVNGVNSGLVINVSAGTYPGFTVFYKNVTIQGVGPGTVTIDGSQSDIAYGYIPYNGATVTIYNLSNAPLPTVLSRMTIKNGLNDSYCLGGYEFFTGGYSCGGGIANYTGQVTLNNVIVTNNSAQAGGGIYNAGYLSLNSSTVTGNFAGGGGGIFNDNPFCCSSNFGQVQLNSSQVTNNLAFTGGGIFNFPAAGLVALNSSTASGNSASTTCSCASANYGEFDGLGGGFFNLGGSLSITNSKVTGNEADFTGGGIASGSFEDHTFTLAQTTIAGTSVSQNTAAEGGGIVNLDGAGLTINNSPSNQSVVSYNKATEYDGGGVLNLFGGSVQVNGSQIVFNTAYNSGGGLVNAVFGALTISNGVVRGNVATYGDGGGIDNEACGALNVNRTMVQNNTAGDDGGGLYYEASAPPTLAGDKFGNNLPDNIATGVNSCGPPA